MTTPTTLPNGPIHRGELVESETSLRSAGGPPALWPDRARLVMLESHLAYIEAHPDLATPDRLDVLAEHARRLDQVEDPVRLTVVWARLDGLADPSPIAGAIVH